MAEGSTPMMKQYHGLRAQIPPDALLLFRLGDFYELFFRDAEEGSRLLHLTLTKRNGVPMCGLPYHASEGYITKLLQAGRRVAICDQVSEAKPGQMVERAISRILSPGCAVGVELSEPKLPRWLAAVWKGNTKSQAWGFALLDATTGDFRLAEPTDEISCREEIRRAQPAELLLDEEEKRAGEWVDAAVSVARVPEWTFEEDTARRTLCEHFQVQSLDGFGCRGNQSRRDSGPGNAHIRCGGQCPPQTSIPAPGRQRPLHPPILQPFSPPRPKEVRRAGLVGSPHGRRFHRLAQRDGNPRWLRRAAQNPMPGSWCSPSTPRPTSEAVWARIAPHPRRSPGSGSG